MEEKGNPFKMVRVSISLRKQHKGKWMQIMKQNMKHLKYYTENYRLRKKRFQQTDWEEYKNDNVLNYIFYAYISFFSVYFTLMSLILYQFDEQKLFIRNSLTQLQISRLT